MGVKGSKSKSVGFCYKFNGRCSRRGSEMESHKRLWYYIAPTADDLEEALKKHLGVGRDGWGLGKGDLCVPLSLSHHPLRQTSTRSTTTLWENKRVRPRPASACFQSVMPREREGDKLSLKALLLRFGRSFSPLSKAKRSHQCDFWIVQGLFCCVTTDTYSPKSRLHIKRTFRRIIFNTGNNSVLSGLMCTQIA